MHQDTFYCSSFSINTVEISVGFWTLSPFRGPCVVSPSLSQHLDVRAVLESFLCWIVISTSVLLLSCCTWRDLASSRWLPLVVIPKLFKLDIPQIKCYTVEIEVCSKPRLKIKLGELSKHVVWMEMPCLRCKQSNHSTVSPLRFPSLSSSDVPPLSPYCPYIYSWDSFSMSATSYLSLRHTLKI